MSETTELVERLRNGAGIVLDEVGGIHTNIALLDEAANRIEYLEFELGCVTDERDKALNEVSVLTQERDEARAESSCAHDQVKQLQNEVRL
jgi:uncharacterized coiled-coil DUF342 family protein